MSESLSKQSLTFNSIYKNVWVIYFPAWSWATLLQAVLLRRESYNGQVGRKQLFCAGGYDWWGSLWQCRKLMSQNHESSCREITPPQKKARRDIFNTKQMQRERHADWKWDAREQSLCHCFASTVIHFFNMHFSLTVHKLQPESECQHIYRQTRGICSS